MHESSGVTGSSTSAASNPVVYHPLPCRVCRRLDLHVVLAYGDVPLANSLLTSDQLLAAEPRHSLDLTFCPHCCLVQIPSSPPPEDLFSDYLYFSSYSETMLAHARELCQHVISLKTFNESSLVVEIASNDGYLLQNYLHSGIPVLGVEPAANVASWAREHRRIPTVVEFFNSEFAKSRPDTADVIHAHNVFAHVPDPMDFLQGIRTMLKPDGICIIEVPYLGDLVSHLEFDTVYHEHIYYFSLLALIPMIKTAGLRLRDVEHQSIHGGTMRLYLDRLEGESQPSVPRWKERELSLGVHQPGYYQQFASRVQKLGTDLRQMLEIWKQDGKTIAGYGAAAKGTTLLNLFGIGADLIDFVVDRSPHKQGKYIPGVHIPILGPEALLAHSPDYTLILAWNFAHEICLQQASYTSRGGRFVVPLPELCVLEP